MSSNSAQKGLWICTRSCQNLSKNVTEILTVFTLQCAFLANLLAFVSLAQPAELLSKRSALSTQIGCPLSLFDTSAFCQRLAILSLLVLPLGSRFLGYLSICDYTGMLLGKEREIFRHSGSSGDITGRGRGKAWYRYTPRSLSASIFMPCLSPVMVQIRSHAVL